MALEVKPPRETPGALTVPSDTEAQVSPGPGNALPCAAGCSRKHEVPSKRKQ